MPASADTSGRLISRRLATRFAAVGVAVGMIVASTAGPALAAPRASTSDHACTKTSTGSCIRGGERCADNEHGKTGYDADGKQYVCRDNDGYRWEPVADSTSSGSSSGGSSGGTTTKTIKTTAIGRFIDGTVGGMPLESLVDVEDARASAPPDKSVHNPLDAKLLGQLEVPLSGKLQLPGGGVFSLGAANQIATAHSDGYSYGASGAVANTGGADLTDDQGAFPSDATIDLSAAALGSVPIPGLPALPGLPAGSATSATALGGIAAKIGALQSLAQTSTGGKIVAPQSKVGDIDLIVGSPALAALLGQLKTILGTGSTLSGQLGTLLGALGTLPPECGLSLSSSVDPISLDDGGVVIDPANATITVDVAKLLKKLTGLDISDLTTANFDLITFLAKSLPKILSTGLSGLITGITDPLKNQFTACATALGNIPILGGLTSTLIGQLTSALTAGEAQITGAVASLGAQFSAAASGPLGMLASGLEMAVDIGLNVQDGPNHQPYNTDYPFTSSLAAAADQADSPVDGTSVVRAVEIDLLKAAGNVSGNPISGSLPTSFSAHERQLAGRAAAAPHAAAAPGDGVAVLALSNASVVSSATTTTSTTTPTGTTPPTAIPTGVPAGDAAHTVGSSALQPLILLLLFALVFGAGSVLALRRSAADG